MHEIRLLVSDSALRDLQTILMTEYICGNQSPAYEPMVKIVQALLKGESDIILKLKGKTDGHVRSGLSSV